MKFRILELFERYDSEWLIALAGSTYISFKRGTFCRVRPGIHGWIHRYPDGTLVQTAIGGRTASMLDEKARDEFLYAYSPESGDVVVDVGAGTGSELLTFSRAVGGKGAVVAIEAHPRIFGCLKEAIHLNRLQNVIPLQLAVSDAPGQTLLTDMESHISNTVVRSSDDGIPVQTRRLDSILDELSLDTVSLLKMNIEGAESSALEGLGDSICMVRHVAIACHDFVADRTGDDSYRTLELVADHLRAHGFTLKRRMTDPRPWVRDTIYGSRS